MNRFQRSLLQATTIAILSIAPVYAADNVDTNTATDSALFTSGGVGDAEAAAIKSERGQYNVHLLLTEKSGAYLSGVKIKLTDRKGTAVVDTVSEGPFFYAKLPDGQYTLIADSDGITQQRKLVVRGGKAADVHLTF